MQRIGVIGAGRFGSTLATGLSERGTEVILIDINEDLIQRMAQDFAKAVVGDSSDPQILKEAGFDTCDAVVVTVSANMESSILATMALKEMGVGYVVARAQNEMHGKVLEKIGADRVVYPAHDMAIRLAKSLSDLSIIDYVEVTEGASVMEIVVPAKWDGKSLAELKVASEYGVMVVAVQHHIPGKDEPEIDLPPSASDLLKEGDSMMIFGADEKLKKFKSAFQ